MMLWGWGGSAASAGVAEDNYPSLWSGGWTWEVAASGTGTQGYWQSSANPTDRTGLPELSVAIGGAPVRHTVLRASFSLGQSGWLDTIQPSSASLEVEGEVEGEVMDEVVIALMSDVTTEHSAPLWVGYVDDISTTTDTGGRVTSSVSLIDIVGRLGQAPAPETPDFASTTGGNLAEYIEYVALEAGVLTYVVDDSIQGVSLFSHDFDDDDTALAAIARLETEGNSNVFLRGDGRLVVARRFYVEDDLDPAPTPVDLSGAAAPATWTVRRSPTSVINDWGDIYFPSDEQLASRERYGRRSYAAPDDAGWDQLISLTGSLMQEPRATLEGTAVPITDLGHAALFASPADWATVGGETYQVLSVQHEVAPGHQWTVTLTGDSTQPLLHAEFEP